MISVHYLCLIYGILFGFPDSTLIARCNRMASVHISTVRSTFGPSLREFSEGNLQNGTPLGIFPSPFQFPEQCKTKLADISPLHQTLYPSPGHKPAACQNYSAKLEDRCDISSNPKLRFLNGAALWLVYPAAKSSAVCYGGMQRGYHLLCWRSLGAGSRCRWL